MGKKSRDKGGRVERELVKLLNAIPGLEAERVPLSGAAGGSFSGDIQVSFGTSLTLSAECKARSHAQGWTVIKKWLGDNDFLFLREDRQSPLVVLPWETLIYLITRGKSDTTETPIFEK